MKKRSRRCAECIQNETDRKAARKAAAAKKKAEAMCDCDGKCGRDGCDGGVCGNKVTQSRASKCTKCKNAVKKQRETCATCGDKTRDGVCSCVAEYMQRVEPESTTTSDLYEGLRIPGGVLWENYERMESVKTVSGKRQLNHFRSTILLPHVARHLYRKFEEKEAEEKASRAFIAEALGVPDTAAATSGQRWLLQALVDQGWRRKSPAHGCSQPESGRSGAAGGGGRDGAAGGGGNGGKVKKIGPNEKCPCGGGKKYKKCHGAN